MNKKLLGGLLALAAALPISSPGAEAPRARHVIVISIDGFRPAMYLKERSKEAWPTMLSLQDTGAYALAADPPYPSLTYPGHTTIATGVMPARHGVLANNVFRPPEIEGRGFWYAGDIKTPTLWDQAHAAGLTVATLSWPCTADAKTIDWNFPEFWSSARGQEITYVRRFATPSLLAMADAMGKTTWPRWLTVPHHRDEMLANLAIQLIQTQKPNLILLHLVELDKVQHRYGTQSLRVNFALRRTDNLITRLRQATQDAGLDEQTTFILLGDHGFADVFYSLAPNTLLESEGLVTRSENGTITDWKALVQNTGGSAAVYLKDPDDTDALNKTRSVLLSNAVDLDGNRLYHLVERDELDKMGGPPGAAFCLEAEPEYMFSGSCSGSLVRRALLKGNHGYDPRKPEMKTGFIAAGSGIRRKKLEHISLADVAPTVAALLGFDFPDTDGRVLTEILY